MEKQTYFQKGFGLKVYVQDMLKESYHSHIVEHLRSHHYTLQVEEVTVRLAEEFGFCYGVERAVEYAYETIKKFPGRRIYLTGEIIHNPHINEKLKQLGIRFLSGSLSDEAVDRIAREDVVVIPAFGIRHGELKLLQEKGCIVVDTTCGSVLNVWKNVERYARDGFTSIVHGKHEHEETRATCSQAAKYPNSHFLVVRDLAETEIVCDYIVNGGDRAAFLQRFSKACSADFDPDRHLERIGLANQTTMLSSESLAIAERIRRAMLQKYGAENLADHVRNFDTICSATQDRQDAIIKLVRENLDLMIVIGGYNSSNTNNLAKITSKQTKTYHIEDPACMVSRHRIRHKPIGQMAETVSEGWLPDGPLRIGITAGASTPNNKIGQAIETILALRGYADRLKSLSQPTQQDSLT